MNHRNDPRGSETLAHLGKPAVLPNWGRVTPQLTVKPSRLVERAGLETWNGNTMAKKIQIDMMKRPPRTHPRDLCVRQLYYAVKKAELDGHLLSKECHRAANHLRIDFERGGIHLCPEKLDPVNQLNIDIFHLCREFCQNIINDPGQVDIFPASRIPKHIHHLLKPIYQLTYGTLRESLRSWDDKISHYK